MEQDLKELFDLLDIEGIEQEQKEPPPGLKMRNDALWPGYRRVVAS